MIDINLIRNEPERVISALRKRMYEVDLSRVVRLDDRRRELIGTAEKLKARRNSVSSEIPRMKKSGEDVSTLLSEMKEVSGSIKSMDQELRKLEVSIRQELAILPNLPDDDVPAGGREANETLRSWGEQPTFDFSIRDHIELVGMLGLVDYKRGVKMAGNGFWLYSGIGARLEWALLNFFIDEHLADGYEFVLPPHILNHECGFTAGQFPGFEEDVYQLRRDGSSPEFQFMLPTAESALVNFHRDEILSDDELPKRYFAYTPCYRREAGSYRSQERGMIRGHQFNKVEMFQFTRPADSDAALEELLEKAERLVQQLGLHYRVSKLAAGDASAHVAKTYDIEVWIPSMAEYKEVSSASNARDYQARRGNVRYRPEGQKQTEYVHCLNASGLATSRLIPAIVEQFQGEDGSVRLPDVLAHRLGTQVLEPS